VTAGNERSLPVALMVLCGAVALLLLLGGWVLIRLVPAVGNRVRSAVQRVSARRDGPGGWRRWRGA